MVDFSKLRLKKHDDIYTLMCDRCGATEEYLSDLKGWKHHPTVGRCNGTLVLVAHREEPKK